MIYLFDTSILLHFLRSSPLAQKIDQEHDPFNSDNTLLLSVVSEGEIRSISLQLSWGVKRIQKLESDLKEFGIIPVRSKDIISRYAEIDAYSQNKLAGQPLGSTPRNMGKNDLWIAATASVLGAKLLTTDSDFNHLEGKYVDLICVNPIAV